MSGTKHFGQKEMDERNAEETYFIENIEESVGAQELTCSSLHPSFIS